MLSAIKNHAFYSLPILNRNIFSLDLIPKDKHSLKIQLAYFTAPQFYKRSQVSLAKSVTVDRKLTRIFKCSRKA